MKHRLDNQPTPLSALLLEGEGRLKESGIETARKEAEILLLSLLSLRRIDLYLYSNRPVSQEDRTEFLARIERRGRREPLQYIIGEVDFCGLPFFVGPGVFIPRPETEFIVEAASHFSPDPQCILDLCTGSGALAISLAKRFPSATITAIDCCTIALATARRNQKRHQVPWIDFREGNLFSGLNRPVRFDLIVCNPPYIAESDWGSLDPDVLEYEPPLALFSPEGGFSHLTQILIQAADFLAPNGQLILEMGCGQSAQLVAFVKNKTSFTVRIAVCQWTKS